MDSYRDAGEKDFEENLNLCDEEGKLPGLDTSLVTVRDQARGTLNLVVITWNIVDKLRMYSKNIPKTDVIHLHREIGDIIYTYLLQDTLQISKL